MINSDKPKLLVLVGPTAVGKTKLSLELARIHGCEIISGDSMQVYRGMDVGTAKISYEEQEGIPHHLIDIIEPDEAFSAASFQQYAEPLILDIQARGQLPFIVGGTGLYIESLCYQFQFSEATADEAFRQEQAIYLAEHGELALHEKLRAVDPTSAERLHPNNTRRVVRALEILHLTGITLSTQLAGQLKQSPYELCIIGLTMDRDLLYKRIEHRIDLMLEQGLVEEVRMLLDKGYTTDYVSMQGLGYKEIIRYLQGEYTLEAAITLLKRDTRHFAKRQLSWFRHMKDINWVDVTDFTNFSTHLQKINDIIAGKFTLP
ncbi:tRNA (adenosine(37)-N6)-dimethylallyltransferase MiaA [Paenibacillus psychroresistens]|uniref:tRNA dimethylallyltransferase n=1 Tax=Paenibacillus psychroresistens TaxID=1778678 RepID=A0A6B8RX63_9BACL|nr:tRNA (adenosine(37)-N6)-dimethylallyltransferase MiaA [Paenibacillus psychroresistens]QGR00150.1 tRNA (adenosine(37)-N6)-dimethylallyltransferase MiaA [Paenibacillus psychroresistens]